MSGLPWFKCSPRDFREGMMGLTCEERGAYATILLLIYERGEPIPDDVPWLCANLTISARTWMKIRAVLIVRGKLFETESRGVPALMNRRAEAEISGQMKLREKLSSGGRNSKRTPEVNEINDQASTELEPSSSHAEAQPLKIEDLEEVREEIKVISPDGETCVSAEIIPYEFVSQSDPADGAFHAYQEVARELGLPVPRKLDADRRAKLRSRLKDVGEDGWHDALSRARASPFLRGDASNFRLALDWLLKPLNLRKVLEGNYEDKRNERWSANPVGRQQQRVEGVYEGLMDAVNERKLSAGGGSLD